MAKLLVLALTLLLAACGGGGGQQPAGTGAAPGTAEFRTRTPGVLTVATELPNPPFVLGDDLAHLEGGFEVDMVQAIAERLGISSPYFTANQGVLVRKGTGVAGVADARRLRFGVQEATSGAIYLDKVLKPVRPPRIYASTTAAFGALRAGQIDAVMSDVPIVVDAAAKYPGLAVVGQFKTDEQYGAVLAKGSPNTRPLSEVIDQLRDEGVLDQLFQKYFPEQVDIPSLG